MLVISRNDIESQKTLATFVIVENLPKTNWKDPEIQLCIAYLQVLPEDHWAVDWIWDNCPITQKHLNLQPKTVTMKK